jgi:hypothetical protein
LARKSWNDRLAGEAASIRTDRWTWRLADGLGDWPEGIARSLKSWELDWTADWLEGIAHSLKSWELDWQREEHRLLGEEELEMPDSMWGRID